MDLAKFMNEIDVTPDFGFDAEDVVVESFKEDPWNRMLYLLGTKTS